MAAVPEVVWRVAALVAVVASVAGLWVLDSGADRIAERLRTRLVMGVPWGTLASLSAVLAFYLIAQHGFAHWYRPVTAPYRAWSYFYPLGVLTAAFAHVGTNHLIGNLTSALVVMPVAEYAFGHFPRRRGSGSFAASGGLLARVAANPWLRALVVFPAGVALVGLATALFSWGPIIGFSGVVFAAVGFALVRYPLAAVVAMVARQGVLLAYRSLQNPVLVVEASSTYSRPGWAGIAVQGHALGLFLGAALAILVCYRGSLIRVAGLAARSDDRPSAARLWLGTVLIGLTLGLWALWWYRGGDTFVLYRAAGLAVVMGIGLLVTAAVASSDRRLFDSEDWLTRRQLATLLLLIPLLSMSLVAIPLHAVTVADAEAPEGTEPLELRDYTVVYAEDVPNQMVNVVDVSLFGETTQVRTSGVVVFSERRHLWFRPVSKGELAANGRAQVVVGGPTWREVVDIRRNGWSAAGGPSAYQVVLWQAGQRAETRRVAYTSPPATAEPVIAGRNVTVVPADDRFGLRVTRNNTTLGRAPIPEQNETVTAGGITFTRDGPTVVASYEGTRVTVARKESYN